MKLTDDKKAKEEPGILFENCKDIEIVSTESRREEVEAGNNGKVKVNMHGVSGKCIKDGVMVNGKKVKEEEKKNNFNMDIKEQEKNIKSITEDLEKLGIDYGAMDKKNVPATLATDTGKLRHSEQKEESQSLAEIGSVKVEIKGNADKGSLVEDITASMHKLGLGTGNRMKDKDLANRNLFDSKRILCGFVDEHLEPHQERFQTVEIIAQPEGNKCAENEDFEETRVLSDACDDKAEEPTCNSLVGHGPFGGVAKSTEHHNLSKDFEETRVLSDACDYKTEEPACKSLIGRGPLGGVAKRTEHHDLKEILHKAGDDHFSDCSQARKYVRPSTTEGYNPIMSGGCVQVVQPDTHVRSLYETRDLEDLNISSQYLGQRQDNFIWHTNPEVPAEQRIMHPYSNDDLRNYTNGWHAMQHCPPFYGGSPGPRDAVNPPMDELADGFEHGANTLWFDPELLCKYALDMGHGMGGMPFDNHLNHYQFHGQMGVPNMPFPSSHSPHDHCLTSPGSSPPSVLSYPLSPTSTILTNGDPDLSDLSVLSPGQFSLSSPESGFITDTSGDGMRDLPDLDDALEFINEEMAASCRRANEGSVSLLPVVVETAESYPSSDLVLGFTGAPFKKTGSVSHQTKPKKPPRQPRIDTKRSRKVTQPAPEMASRILPPVGGSLPCTTFYSPSVLNNQLPTALQLPCFVVEPPRTNQRQSTRPPIPIQPKITPESSAPPAIKPAVPTDVSPTAVPRFSLPSPILSSSQEPTVTSSSDQDQLVKAYRAVAGLPKEQLLGQDDDGDTILHLAIVKDKTKLVKALLERYVREGMIDKVINLANKQHQTPLCLAVFLNQTEIVKMLIERKADVNVQLQRKLNGGLKCYRLIHYSASRGRKWVPTLIQLLSADNIDLQAFNSEGCTAMHCAIEFHGKHYQQGDEKINSKDTIYYLAKRGADLNVQHGLCGKTPLHYAIGKDSDLVSWFLGLASYLQSSDPKQPKDLVHSLLNARPSGGVTALQLALTVHMEQTERIPILKMLLRDGAEVSQKGCDGKLRQELAKFPELAGLLRNGTNTVKNGPR